MMIWSDLLFILPELILTIGASALLLLPLFGDRQENGSLAKWITLLLLGMTAASVIACTHLVSGVTATSTLQAMFAFDAFAVFFKLLFVATMIMIVLISEDYLREEGYSPWEYYALLLFALCGMSFMASGMHLVSIWVGLELMSLSSYILAGYYKREVASTEAAMKYFILGAVSSAILLYGVSLIYGVCGTLQLEGIRAALGGVVENDVMMFGIIMLGAGLAFKIAAVPFHVWTPDVYVGAPTPITAFLSTASKAAAFSIFARIFYLALPDFHLDWRAIIATLAALSMIVGNLAAITQTNVKRMLAYSSIGHAGYGLLGIVSLSAMGLQGLMIYMIVYIIASIGIWATILMLRREQYAGEAVDDFEGLHQRSPFLAFAMVIFLLSLGGIPPTAGFIGKYFLFAAAVGSGFGWLAIIAVLMSAVSMFYYLRLVVAMYLKEGRSAEIVVTGPLRFAVAICLLLTFALGILPQGMIQQTRESSRMAATPRASLK